MPKNNKKPYKRPPRVRDGAQVSVYLDPELLEKLETLRVAENRSKGNMAVEIIRRYFAGETRSNAAA